MSNPEPEKPESGASDGQTPQQRQRIEFARGEAIKYVSHLDLSRTWERIFRRADLPLAYSQGFNPRPRFQIAAALPVGVTGRAELLDVWLVERLAAEDVVIRLRPAAPAGLEILGAEEVDLRGPALQSLLRTAEYRARVHGKEPIKAIEARIEALLQAPALPRQRQHKGRQQTYDLRPLVQALSVRQAAGGEAVVEMRLQASPAGAGRPDEVLDVLGLSLAAHSIERTNLCFEFDK